MALAPRPVVLKFGGELLEDRAHLTTVTSAVAAISRHRPLVVVHGGGREIDAALEAAGIEKRQVDGLRITDSPTLEIVVSVVAGAVNTRLVAALTAAGVAAVGLTGADANCGLSLQAPAHRAVDGRTVDLDRVGVPSRDADMRLLGTLMQERFVPVMACIGVGRDGQLFNVNADTLAGFIAAEVGATRLVIAGTTPGVLDANGRSLAEVGSAAIAGLVSSRTATAGMIAKLRACEHALEGNVDDVVIVDGRDGDALMAAATGEALTKATRLTAGLKACPTGHER